MGTVNKSVSITTARPARCVNKRRTTGLNAGPGVPGQRYGWLDE
jgi:hypothetical protein